MAQRTALADADKPGMWHLSGGEQEGHFVGVLALAAQLNKCLPRCTQSWEEREHAPEPRFDCRVSAWLFILWSPGLFSTVKQARQPGRQPIIDYGTSSHGKSSAANLPQSKKARKKDLQSD